MKNWSLATHALLTAALALPALAQTAQDATAVIFQGGRVLAITGGGQRPVTNSLALSSEINVLTNGTFSVTGGAARPMREGQILGADGRLMSPSGAIEVVFDHVTTDHGQVTLVKDGKRSPITTALKLPNGTQVSPDAWVTAPDGKRTRLLDGQMIRLSGAPIAAKDTVTLTKGEVIVQKDGARFTVARPSSMMMSDGTKVFGTGRVVYRDGREEKLSEGQIIVVEGAR